MGTQRGSATAETALVLPVLVVVAMGLAWGVSVAGAQVRVVDAARETARAVARGDGHHDAVAIGRRVAPDGARVMVRDDGRLVTVLVSAEVSGPGSLWEFLPALQVDAEAVTAAEYP